MKKVTRTLLFIGSIFFLPISFADNFEDHFHFDQSVNVYFDQLSSTSFSQDLLQSKDSFTYHDIYTGGSMQFDAQSWNGDFILTEPPSDRYENGQGVYFTQATFDIMDNLNAWSMAYFSITDSAIGNNNPDGNSVYVGHAFLLLGNLDKSPFFFTAGINTISFGAFNGVGSWDTPLTADYFNSTQAPQLSFGFNNDNWYATLSEFEDQTNYEYHSVINFLYNKTINDFTYNIGAGYLTNYNANDANNAAAHRETVNNRDENIGYLGNIEDINSSLQYKNLSLDAEFDIGNTKANTNPGYPNAYSVVLSYSPTIAGEATSFGIDRSGTANMAHVPAFLPGNDGLSSAFVGLQSSWNFGITRNLAKNVTAGLNAQFAKLYQRHDESVSKHTNTYTLDLTAYL